MRANEARRIFALQHALEWDAYARRGYRDWAKPVKVLNLTSRGLYKAWSKTQLTEKQRRVAGLLHHTTKRKAARLARLGAAKLCACGCGTQLRPGRTWVSGHNAGITPRTYSPESRAAFKVCGLRVAAKNKATGINPGAEAWRGKQQTVAHKKKNSIGVKRAIAEGRFSPSANVRKAWAQLPLDRPWISGKGRAGLHRSGSVFSHKNNKELYYQSSWELARIETLEKDKNVLRYSRTPVRLNYKLKGISHFYFPDFMVVHLDGSIAIEEIKPKNLLSHKTNRLKVALLQRFCKKAGYVCRVLTSMQECMCNTQKET